MNQARYFILDISGGQDFGKVANECICSKQFILNLIKDYRLSYPDRKFIITKEIKG